MLIDATINKSLGLPSAPLSLLRLADEVTRGLPLSALDRVVHDVAPNDSSFVFRLVPRATLARRRKASTGHTEPPRLSPEEGARLARLATIWAFARQVWGSDEEARSFLFRPHAMLDGRRPVDVVLATEFGLPVIEGILGRLQYGAAA